MYNQEAATLYLQFESRQSSTTLQEKQRDIT